MTDITKIPTDELLKDLYDSYDDILVCQEGLNVGVTEYSGGLVADRLAKNKYFVEVITTELDRRGVSHNQV